MIKGEIWWADLPRPIESVPGNLLLEKNDSNLGRSTVINFSQIVTIDKTWLTEVVGMLTKAPLKLVDEKLKLIFDIK